MLDADQSGKISLEELSRFMGENVSEEMDAIIREADRNGDGELDLEEFKEVILSKFN